MNEYVYKEGINGISAIVIGIVLTGLSIFRISPNIIWCICSLIASFVIYFLLMKLNIFLTAQIIFKIIYKMSLYMFIGLVICHFIELIFKFSSLDCQLFIGLLMIFIH